ncbi:MAG: hypothetical protein ABIJ61_12240 [bacterium]
MVSVRNNRRYSTGRLTSPTIALLAAILALASLSCSHDDDQDLNDAQLLSVCIEFEGCDSALINDAQRGGAPAALAGNDLNKGIPRAFGLELCWTTNAQTTLVATPALPTASDLILELRTQQGVLLATLADAALEAGYCPICHDFSGLGNGVYSVYMEAGTYHIVRQFKRTRN